MKWREGEMEGDRKAGQYGGLQQEGRVPSRQFSVQGQFKGLLSETGFRSGKRMGYSMQVARGQSHKQFSSSSSSKHMLSVPAL